ncbi:hypothetical protein [Nostoc sp. UHCC 0251]|uniref:hypothetical protein n=1 Tax=Nostoc sp. UHCC 0251 TaxID=3110240 RepID=UPI002B1F1C09|nr:hypothetical protein [Nostoc sp. UHCC 0251]MEA5627670.1 hypothetical protein [Nostoc sp. UHCC 0251]
MARASKPADSVELARIMRNKDMEDGIVISYLQSKKRGQTELVCEALRAYYLPFALSAAGVSGVELQSALHDAIAQLEVQIIKMKRTFGMEGLPQIVLVNPHSGVFSQGASGLQPTIGTNGVGITPVSPNLVPPSVSFFDSTGPSPVSLPVATEPVGSNVVGEDSEDDEFFNDDEDDLIAKAEIEVDAGFRLE